MLLSGSGSNFPVGLQGEKGCIVLYFSLFNSLYLYIRSV